MSIWFTSDHHFFHRNILAYCSGRGCDSVEEMNELLVENHNARVSDSDTVYFLGDVAMGGGSNLVHVPRMKGRKILIPGNHDNCHPMHKRSSQHARKYMDAGFDKVLGDKHILGAGILSKSTLLCHMPPEGESFDGRPDRFVQWRPGINFPIVICGHVHDQWKTRTHRVITKNNGEHGAREVFMINVGVDVWNMSPVHSSEIQSLIDNHS